MGYASEICVTQGETIRFMVSEVGTAARYAARLMRMHSLDEDPDGCGLIEGRRRPNLPGSTRRASSRLPQAHIWPTRPGSGTATILACWNDEDATGFKLKLDEKGALALRLGFVGGAAAVVSTNVPLRPGEWVFVSASYDAASGRVVMSQVLARPLSGNRHHGGLQGYRARRRAVAGCVAACHRGSCMRRGVRRPL